MNEEDLAIDMDVIDVQRTDFGATDAGGVKNFEDSSIANSKRRGDVGLLQNSLDFIRGQDRLGKRLGLLG